MADSTAVRFDIKTSPQFVGYEDMLRVWREADELPAIGGAWLFDHFMPLGPDQTGPIFEGWTLLAAYAALTERLRLGIMVTGNTYRHPAVLANMAVTVDHVSKGRLDFGIGAGWFEFEHRAYGIPYPSTGQRIRRLGEACEVIRLLWTEKAPSFDGRYYHLENAYCEPKPVQKPYPHIVIGGGGEQLTLPIVAWYADIWNFAGGDVDTFRHKNEVIDRHCAENGRDPAEIVRSVQLRVSYDDPGPTREEARAFVDAGARHVLLMLSPPYPEGIVRRLVEEIVEPVQKQDR
jgi:F420-dependent oxidoreductase-like protein